MRKATDHCASGPRASIVARAAWASGVSRARRGGARRRAARGQRRARWTAAPSGTLGGCPLASPDPLRRVAARAILVDANPGIAAGARVATPAVARKGLVLHPVEQAATRAW